MISILIYKFINNSPMLIHGIFFTPMVPKKQQLEINVTPTSSPAGGNQGA
jgi:hypothetical protein